MTIPFSSTSASISVLKTKSAAALSIFTKTVKELETLNTAAQLEATRREEKIKVLQDEHADLTALQTSNLKVIEKINSILS